MTLLQKIKDHQLEARKQKDAVVAALLTTLYSEAAMAGKNNGNRESTDEEVIAVVKKFYKDNGVVLDSLDSSVHPDVRNRWELERTILAAYLPKQLTESELLTVFNTYKHFADENPNLPAFMKYLKDGYAGQYDGKLAVVVAKRELGQ